MLTLSYLRRMANAQSDALQLGEVCAEKEAL